MDAIGYDLSRDFIRIQDGADDSGLPGLEPAHGIEEVGRVCNPPLKTSNGLLISCFGVADCDHCSSFFKPGDKTDVVPDFRSQRHDDF